MASIENSLKYEAEVEPGKVRLVTSGEFVRAYNHSAWLFYCCISKYKVRIINAYKGVEFLGAYLKPYRTYPSTKSLRRMRGRMKTLDRSERPQRIQARVNSMLGVLSHYDCYQMRRLLVYKGRLRDMGEVSKDCLRFYPDRLRILRGETKFGGAS